MDYSIKKLAEICGISVRTLRYYDQIGLLVPRIRMSNGRRYYGREEVLLLEQILMLKELGFSLEKIQSIMKESSRHKLCALKAQKLLLLKEQERINKSLQLIDVLFEQSNQEKKVLNQEHMQNPLEILKNKQEYAQYFDESYAKEKVDEIFDQFRIATGDEYFDKLKQKRAHSNLLDAQIYGQRYGQFLNEIYEAMEQKWAINSTQVQQIIERQWKTLKLIYPDTNSKRIYLAIRDQIYKNPIARKDKESEPIFEYISQAMEIFAEKHFSKD